MLSSIDLWFEYLLRFSHLIAGIAWIGSSFYFIWLDNSFEAPHTPRKNVDGETFMVHGGFYYQVEKRKIFPGEIPKTLHWFKWEATLTWITGIFLLAYLYFFKGAALLIDPKKASLTQLQAVAVSLLVLTFSWFIYDLVWHPRFCFSSPDSVDKTTCQPRVKVQIFSKFFSLIAFCLLVFLLNSIFSGKGAFILTGAVLGSLMVLNVWVRILPGQKRMLNAALSGRFPDYSESVKSKTRSVHNTYFIFPVLFTMLSNHYPQVYNHRYNVLLLIILCVAGALVRHTMVTKNKKERWLLLPAVVLLMGLVFITGHTSQTSTASPVEVSYQQIKPILQARCYSCHSNNPTDDIFKVPQKGLVLETEAQFVEAKGKIFLHVVQAESMPLGNKTGMTKKERELFARFIESKH